MCICKILRYLCNKKANQDMNKRFESFDIVIPASHQTDISKSTNKTYGECCICLEQLNDLYALPCAHLFHEHCIRLWLKNHTKCPMCEESV